MTSDSRTTETENIDYATIRDLMHQVQDRLDVPNRARLAVGIVGHLATLMNSHQMVKFMTELNEEAERVQDVPPTRRRDFDERTGET